MRAWRSGCALLLMCMGFTGSLAKGPDPWEPTVRDQAGSSQNMQHLTSRQIELVRRVNGYFNELPMLQGSFVQTGTDGKRRSGKVHFMRPGRFRFDFAPPARVVIISNGKQLAVQDYGLKTDDRKELSETPFRALLHKDVDLLRDAVVSDVSEADDVVMIGFTDASAAGSVKLLMQIKPVVRLKGWIVRDNQSLDTRVDLTDLQPVGSIDQRLFDPASKLERNDW
jgi:outer membrane lipoprotein-sorting protein